MTRGEPGARLESAARASARSVVRRMVKARRGQQCRALFFGGMGNGKSTLAEAVGRLVSRTEGRLLCIDADPGSPAFGVPGAVSLGAWEDDDWETLATVPLCTLDAVRFRLPLLQAIARLARQASSDYLIVDAPGVVRGVAGAELLTAFVESLDIDITVVVDRKGDSAGLANELGALRGDVMMVAAHADAKRPSASQRATQRTERWNRFLSRAETGDLKLDGLRILGTPPGTPDAIAWQGRQVALLDDEGAPCGFGEVVDRQGNSLRVNLVGDRRRADALVLRDAQRNALGALVTAVGQRRVQQPEPLEREALHVGAGPIIARLINGVFGDPLLEVQLRGERDRLLFDLGDSALVSRRVLHTVTDVFITHAHFDHICGFPGLLRARMTGRYPPCRIYGPPGICDHVTGFVNGIAWDRIGDDGPEFLVAEILAGRLEWSLLKVGRGVSKLPAEPIVDGAILQRPGLTVSAIPLDHGIRVFAYALQLTEDLHVDKSALRDLGLAPGPWIRELKHLLVQGATDAQLELPDGARARAGVLGAELIRTRPGKKLVYATDFADTRANRDSLTEHALRADLLICEATFRIADREQALNTGHITTRACGEIAAQARVKRLVPFHFSKRYKGSVAAVYQEVAQHAGNAAVMEYGFGR